MEIGIVEYQEAVMKLITLAKLDTSGGRAAAQVVLSAYNGGEWQFDITDLCMLDRKHYRSAMNVIRGRVELDFEPHRLIENGVHVFGNFWDRWEQDRVQNRWKQACWTCHGRGVVRDYDDNCNETGQGKCIRCNGTGLIGEV